MTINELIQQANIFRKNPTQSEILATQKLAERGKDYFLTQVPFGYYILDIVIPSKGLIVEIDGDYHHLREQRKRDKRRDTFCEHAGMLILRVSNCEVVNILQLIDKFPDIIDGYKYLYLATQAAQQLMICAVQSAEERLLNIPGHLRGHKNPKNKVDYILKAAPRRSEYII